jgi:hypothetical protein
MVLVRGELRGRGGSKVGKGGERVYEINLTLWEHKSDFL